MLEFSVIVSSVYLQNVIFCFHLSPIEIEKCMSFSYKKNKIILCESRSDMISFFLCLEPSNMPSKLPSQTPLTQSPSDTPANKPTVGNSTFKLKIPFVDIPLLALVIFVLEPSQSPGNCSLSLKILKFNFNNLSLLLWVSSKPSQSPSIFVWTTTTKITHIFLDNNVCLNKFSFEYKNFSFFNINWNSKTKKKLKIKRFQVYVEKEKYFGANFFLAKHMNLYF